MQGKGQQVRVAGVEVPGRGRGVEPREGGAGGRELGCLPRDPHGPQGGALPISEPGRPLGRPGTGDSLPLALHPGVPPAEPGGVGPGTDLLLPSSPAEALWCGRAHRGPQ